MPSFEHGKTSLLRRNMGGCPLEGRMVRAAHDVRACKKSVASSSQSPVFWAQVGKVSQGLAQFVQGV